MCLTGKLSTRALLTVMFALLSPLGAQEEAGIELEFQSELTAEYEVYLFSAEEILRDAIAADFDADAARTGLALVLLAQLQFEVDGAGGRIDDARLNIEADLEELVNLLADEIDKDDPQTPDELVESAVDRLFDDRSQVFEDDFGEIADAIEASAIDVEEALTDLGTAVVDRVDEIDMLFAEVREADAPFSLTVYFDDGTDVRSFEITRDDVDALADADAGEAGSQELADLLGLAGDETADEDLKSLGDDLRAAEENVLAALDILETASSAEENLLLIEDLVDVVANLDAAIGDMDRALDESPMALSTTAVSDLLDDLDAILSGREFTVGDMVVRPAALIENRSEAAAPTEDLLAVTLVLASLAQADFANAEALDTEQPPRSEKARLRGWLWVMLAAGAVGLTDSPETLMVEFYSSPDPRSHTFRGYFPTGLSTPMMEMIGADMIVSAHATKQEFDDDLEGLRTDFRQRFDADPDDAEARAGLAIVRTYFTLAADSTAKDIDAALEDEEIVFLILNKQDDDGAPFVVQADDRLFPFSLTHEPLSAILERVRAMADATAGLSSTVNGTAADADQILELDLDPNELDFSDADTDLEIVEALERSNENFLRVTAQGQSDLVDAGAEIEEQLDLFSDSVSDMRELMEDMEEESGVDLGALTRAMVDLDEFYADVHADFAVPDQVTVIDGTNVDLSAWFDAPPENLLKHFKWYLDDDVMTDDTLAGLLPGVIEQSVILESVVEAVPQAYALLQNFPNPFNSGTVIDFELPGAGNVHLALYNVQGQRVLTLVSGFRTAGSYRIAWDGRDEHGRTLATGVYLYRLESDFGVDSRRLVLLR